MKRIFYIVPASYGALSITAIFIALTYFIYNKALIQGDSTWMYIITLAIMIGMIALLILILYSSRKTSFEVSDDYIRIKGTLYRRTIPLTSLVSDSIKILNIKNEKKYQPKSKTNGMNLIDYKLGWFRLKNKEKSLLFLTDCTRVVYIPTTDDYSILLSVQNPDYFIQSLREMPSEGNCLSE